MLCPFCQSKDTQVIDSRASEEGLVIRRRRRCQRCEKRFTTFERVHLTLPSIIKRGGAKTGYVREKLMASMALACRKRPVSEEKLEEVVSKIEHQMMQTGLREIPSRQLGDFVMKALLELDLVAYIRYASVYLNIDDPRSFISMIEDTLESHAKHKSAAEAR